MAKQKMKLLLAAAAMAAATLLHAQPYPSRAIKIMVPWPAGGLNDVIARTFNDRVSKSLGQTVITDFKAVTSLVFGQVPAHNFRRFGLLGIALIMFGGLAICRVTSIHHTNAYRLTLCDVLIGNF